MAGLVPAIHAVTLGRMDEADRIIGLYERHAHAFDAGRGQSLIERLWLDRFLALSRAAARCSTSAAARASQSPAISSRRAAR
jgi:hypothetical protein